MKDIEIAIKWFELHGCTVLKPKHKNANGPDLNVIKNDECFRVEIKQVRKIKNGSWQVDPVSEPRTIDDFVLILNKTNVVELIAMKNHLSLCSDSGYRIMTLEMRILG